MDFKTFFVKQVMISFFIGVTCICAGMAILGMLFEPDTRFGYQGFLSPLIFGVATMLPSIVSYSKHELSIREMLIRKIIQLVLIELIVLLIVYSSGGLTSVALAVSIAFTVLLVGAAVHLVLWVNDKKTAKNFNKALVRMQQDNK